MRPATSAFSGSITVIEPASSSRFLTGLITGIPMAPAWAITWGKTFVSDSTSAMRRAPPLLRPGNTTDCTMGLLLHMARRNWGRLLPFIVLALPLLVFAQEKRGTPAPNDYVVGAQDILTI